MSTPRPLSEVVADIDSHLAECNAYSVAPSVERLAVLSAEAVRALAAAQAPAAPTAPAA